MIGLKWPEWLMLIRHDKSAYNVLRKKKEEDFDYQKLLQMMETNLSDSATRDLAMVIWERFALGVGDCNTPLESDGKIAQITAQMIEEEFGLPDVVILSPYIRTVNTYDWFCKVWPELMSVKKVEEERVREREYGLSLIYNDQNLFHFFHPLQKRLREIEGEYWYRLPQGENIPDVRKRNHEWLDTLIREFAGKKVMVFTHNINILAMRANLERLNAEEFLDLRAKNQPINCGVTLYRGKPELGKNGKLVLDFYNRKYY